MDTLIDTMKRLIADGEYLAPQGGPVEPPSDYRGVEYIRVDPDGAWKFRLAGEIKHSGLPIDMNHAI